MALAASIALTGSAYAQRAPDTLVIGTAEETSSMFPGYFITTPNQQIMSHIFEPLVAMDAEDKPQPGLAESWRLVDDNTWEFKLRHGVKFSDGSPLTADNVIASFDFDKTVRGNGASAASYVADKKYWKVDDYTVRISAGKPYPLMPAEMTVLYIFRAPASVDDFNSGKAAIGTGPYKLVKWVRGDRLELERNEDYWGEKPEWKHVVFRPITSAATRVAALLNGDVDVIDRVPTADVKRLEADPKLHVVSRPGERSIHIHLDVNRDLSPYVFDNSGKPLWPNPMRDWRVRKAMSLAINRDGIVKRIMDGQAVAAGQVAAPGMFGYDPNLKPDPYDPKKAKQLLTEAGYPDGFALTLDSPNDRYINDGQIAESIAQMWTRIGIKTKAETMPATVYFTRRDSGGERGTPEFSAVLSGFGTSTGETMSQMWQLMHATDPSKGYGHVNLGRYDNIRIDTYLEQAITTMDDAKREQMLKEISGMYMADVALIPLHWQVNVTAMRAGLDMKPRLMEVTHAMQIHSTK
ncbi:MAG: ABC transporter substrate-binding protein [Rhizobiaceae bacterium]